MELTTIVLDFTFYPEKPNPEKFNLENANPEKPNSQMINPERQKEIEDWLTELDSVYIIRQMPPDCSCLDRNERKERVQSFFTENGIIPENALFLSDQRKMLKAAKELEIAILACELSAEEGEGFPMVAERVWETDSDFLLKCYQREHDLPWEILRTDRMILREECEEDIDRLYAMYEQPHVTRFLEPLYPEREQELDYIRKYRCYVYRYYGFGLWHIIDKQTGLSAGRAGLNPKTYSDGVSGVELGYVIAEPFLRQGYCMEICEAILQYARKELELSEVYCLIQPENTVSIHIAKKLGFKFEQKIEDDGRKMCRYFKRLLF